MIVKGKCSVEKFNFLYPGSENMTEVYAGAKEKELDSHETESDMGLAINRAIKDNHTSIIEECVYLVNDAIIDGANRERTQLFLGNGIQVIVLSDGKETIVIGNEGTILHRKSGQTIKIVEKLLIKELNADNTEYNNGIVKTKHFKGSYREIENDCLLVNIYSLLDLEKSLRGFHSQKENYNVIVNKKTNKVVGNNTYSKISSLSDGTDRYAGLYVCSYRNKYGVEALIDTKDNCNTILDKVGVYKVDRFLAITTPLKYRENTVAVYSFDEERRKLKTVVPEIPNAFIRDNQMDTIKKRNKNIMICHTAKGTRDRLYEDDTQILRKVVKVYLNRGDNYEDMVEWIDKTLYEEIKHKIGEEV